MRDHLKEYKIYIDDSGTKEYSPSKIYHFDKGATQLFAFAGISIISGSAGQLSNELRSIKKIFFGCEDVEIKANWLRMASERQKRYLEPYNISEDSLKQFVNAAYNLLDISSITLVGCVVDKLAIQLHYQTPWYAPAIAYDFLMQRVQYEMQEKNAIAHITIDDMRGATPKGNEFKNLLRRQHERLLSSGTPLQKHLAFDHIKTLKFTDSKASDLIQLADLVAYSVYRNAVNKLRGMAPYPYFERIAHKFRKDKSGGIDGYGVVEFPQRKLEEKN